MKYFFIILTINLTLAMNAFAQSGPVQNLPQSYNPSSGHKIPETFASRIPTSLASSVINQSVPNYAETVAYGNILYISGQLGIDPVTGKLPKDSFSNEVRLAMNNLGAVLKKNNLSYNDLINVTIYLTSMENYDITNTIYRNYFKGKLPARVCVAVLGLPKKARIEVSGTAAINR